MVSEYAVPTLPLGRAEPSGVKTRVGDDTLDEYVVDPVKGPDPVDESVAVTTTLKSPASVGVPLKVPSADNERPAGS